jgi:hypothetical protein
MEMKLYKIIIINLHSNYRAIKILNKIINNKLIRIKLKF